jgi:hypothetical protein
MHTPAAGDVQLGNSIGLLQRHPRCLAVSANSDVLWLDVLLRRCIVVRKDADSCRDEHVLERSSLGLSLVVRAALQVDAGDAALQRVAPQLQAEKLHVISLSFHEHWSIIMITSCSVRRSMYANDCTIMH